MKERRELTKNYFGVLGNVYREKGPFAAIAYDFKSTAADLSTILAQLLALGTRPAEREIRHKMRSLRKEYLLRHKKEKKDSGIEGRVAIFLLSVLGGIVLVATSLQPTGNAIGSVSGSGSGLLGVFLFIFGLVGMFFNLRR